jgi:hypothetical protein
MTTTWLPATSSTSTITWSNPVFTTDNIVFNYANPVITLFNTKESKMGTPHVVRIKAGFIGQIWVNQEIAWESRPYKSKEKALARTQRRINKRNVKLYK